MRLLNVRLDDDDARLVRRLRDRGISISTVVRNAIRAEAKNQLGAAPDVQALLQEMQTRFPEPPGTPPRPRIDTTDRRQVARAIRARLRRRA